MKPLKLLTVLAVLGTLLACSTGAKRTAPAEGQPMIIAHRGASGKTPEHTLEAYSRAVQLGADWIAVELVSARDGTLVARRENELSASTDVAQHYPKKRTSKNIEGKETEGWFVEDFSWAELKKLRTKLPGASKRKPKSRAQAATGPAIPSLLEVLEWAKAKQRETGKTLGVVLELRHASYFDSIGLRLEEPLLKDLKRAGLTPDGSPLVAIRSLETDCLKQIHSKSGFRIFQMLGEAEDRPPDLEAARDGRNYADLATPEGLAEIATYAVGIMPSKRLILPQRLSDLKLESATHLVADAKAAKLQIYPYTFRDDPRTLPPAYQGNFVREYRQFFDMGVDGIGTDAPDTALLAREQWLLR